MKKQIPFLDLSCIPPDVDAALKQKFSEILEKGIFSGGVEVTRLEEKLATFLNVLHVIPCSNCTDALEIALRVLGIGPGDEVIVPALHGYLRLNPLRWLELNLFLLIPTNRV